MASNITVDFNANLARFTSAIDKATNDLNKFQSNAQRISGNITKAFGALGVGIGVGAFTALIKGSIDAQDNLLDLSKKTRLSVEQLSGLSSAAKKSGSDLDGTAKAINKLAVEMGKDAEKFALLGVTAKSPLEAFAQLADVMNAIDDPQKRAAVGAAALGKSWQDSAPLMAEGGAAIRQMIEDGQRLSKVTTESAKAADEFNDRLEDLKTRAAGWTTQVANPIVSGILAIADGLSTLEIAGGPGSVFDLMFGKGPQKKQFGATGSFELPTPKTATINKFLGGEGASKAGKTGKSDLDKALAEQKKRMAELNSGFDEQLLSVDTVSRQYDKILEDRAAAMDELHTQRMEMYRIETEGEEAVRETMDKTNASVKEADNFARDMGLTFASAFEDAVIGGEKFSDVLKGLYQDIQRIILRKTITEPLGNFASGLIKEFLPGFATGGSFTVGGSGGTDSQLVAFRATPGEQVSVATPAQQGGGITVNIVEDSSRAGQVSQRQSGGGNIIEVFVDRVRAAVAGDIARGNGPIPAAMASTYGLNRAAGAY